MRIRHSYLHFSSFPVTILLFAASCGPRPADKGLTDPSLQARVKPPAAPSFVGQDLGVLPGDNQTSAFGVNDAGGVVGQSADGSGNIRAFYWNGTMQALTTPGSRGAAYAISSGATEYAVGYENLPGQEHRAVVWTLPSLVPAALDAAGSNALGVNDAGAVVGTYCFSGCGGSGAVWHGVIWVVGTSGRTDIPPLSGYGYAYATDINNQGLAVGGSYGPGIADEGGYLRLAGGGLIPLPPLPGYSNSAGFAVSDVAAGQVFVVGRSSDAEGSTERATQWTVNATSGTIVATVALEQRWAEGVNLAGDVAGTGGSPSNPAASLFTNGSYLALKAPKGASGSVARGMARGAGSPGYVVGETSVKRWPRALRWVIP
jgi:probable HAF family extracellular repeat protein